MSDWKILVTDGLEEIGLTLLRAAGQVDGRRGIEMADWLQRRVIAIPHIGAQTEEAQARAAEDIAGKVLAALRSQALHWKVI